MDPVRRQQLCWSITSSAPVVGTIRSAAVSALTCPRQVYTSSAHRVSSTGSSAALLDPCRKPTQIRSSLVAAFGRTNRAPRAPWFSRCTTTTTSSCWPRSVKGPYGYTLKEPDRTRSSPPSLVVRHSSVLGSRHPCFSTSATGDFIALSRAVRNGHPTSSKLHVSDRSGAIVRARDVGLGGAG